MNIVALLDSMWGWRGYNDAGEEAPRYFRINRENHSGRRLYSLVGDASLLVTNSCRTVQSSANHHGAPDPAWVLDNLKFLQSEKMDLLLVCGKVAKETYERSGFEAPHVIFMDHPAARRWTPQAMEVIKTQIEEVRKVLVTA
jgi:hypothetical protein